MVMKQPECQVKFKEAWLSQWSPAILKIAKADRLKITDEDEMHGWMSYLKVFTYSVPLLLPHMIIMVL